MTSAAGQCTGPARANVTAATPFASDSRVSRTALPRAHGLAGEEQDQREQQDAGGGAEVAAVHPDERARPTTAAGRGGAAARRPGTPRPRADEHGDRPDPDEPRHDALEGAGRR